MKPALLRINQARDWALMHTPFYGRLAMTLSDVIVTSGARACTDGKRIAWRADFVDSLTDKQVRYVLLHETLHPAHGHLWRTNCDRLSNVAGDMEIWHTLDTIPDIEAPPDIIECPSEFKAWPIERIKRALLAKQKEKCDGEQDGEPEDGEQDGEQDGEPEDGEQDGEQDGEPEDDDSIGSFCKPACEPKEQDETRERWERNVIQSAIVESATCGSIPDGAKTELARLRYQGIDWKSELVDFVKSAQSSRNDWTRQSRRMAYQSVIYPRRKVNAIETMVFVRDSSGSTSDPILQATFAGIVSSAISDVGCNAIVLDVDSAIHAEHRLTPGMDCPLELVGGGGTDFRPAFARVRELTELGERIAGVVYLTDLDVIPERFPTLDAWDDSIPTLWLKTDSPYSRQAPFGRVVPIR